MENQQKNELQKSKVIEFEKNISDSVTNRVNALSKDGRLNLTSKLFGSGTQLHQRG